jgi:hypothetical protein
MRRIAAPFNRKSFSWYGGSAMMSWTGWIRGENPTAR